VAAWLAIVALVGNVLLAVLSPAPSRSAPLYDDVLGPLIICTSHGPATGEEGGSQPSASKEHCPACTLLAKIAMLLPVVLGPTVFPELPSERRIQLRLRSLATHLSLGGIRSRAPPLSA
jgi:hypothetical protein